MADSTLCDDTVTRQLTDRYQSYVGLPCDDDVVQPAVISLHPIVILVGNDMVGQGRLSKALPHSLEAGHLLLGHLLVPIPLQGHPLQGHCLLHPPPTRLLLPTAFTHTPAQILLHITQPGCITPRQSWPGSYFSVKQTNTLKPTAEDKTEHGATAKYHCQ